MELWTPSTRAQNSPTQEHQSSPETGLPRRLYEQAIQTGEGRGYLPANALYSSQIVEWRRLRDAGVLEDSTSNSLAARSGSRLSKEQAEIDRLKKQLAANEQKLATTQTALEIMGKAHALLEQISKSADSK